MVICEGGGDVENGGEWNDWMNDFNPSLVGIELGAVW